MHKVVVSKGRPGAADAEIQRRGEGGCADTVVRVCPPQTSHRVTRAVLRESTVFHFVDMGEQTESEMGWLEWK